MTKPIEMSMDSARLVAHDVAMGGIVCEAILRGALVAMLRSHTLTFDGLRETNVRRCETAFHRLDDWSPPEWLACVMGELGELAGEWKKLRRKGRDSVEFMSPAQREAIAHELADVVIYLDLLAARLGIDLGAAVREKFNIVSDRVASPIKL